jgi:hypothetical protein
MRLGAGVPFFAMLGVVIVLGAAVMFFLFNGRNNNGSPVATTTNTPVQESIPSTSTSDTAMNPAMATSTPVQPEATFTKQPSTPVPMLPQVRHRPMLPVSPFSSIPREKKKI